MHDADRVTDLLVAFRESGIGLIELSVAKPTLDEAFLVLTGHSLTLTGHGVASSDGDEADAGASAELEGSRA
jgi:hypothetical protein